MDQITERMRRSGTRSERFDPLLLRLLYRIVHIGAQFDGDRLAVCRHDVILLRKQQDMTSGLINRDDLLFIAAANRDRRPPRSQLLAGKRTEIERRTLQRPHPHGRNDPLPGIGSLVGNPIIESDIGLDLDGKRFARSTDLHLVGGNDQRIPLFLNDDERHLHRTADNPIRGAPLVEGLVRQGNESHLGRSHALGHRTFAPIDSTFDMPCRIAIDREQFPLAVRSGHYGGRAQFNLRGDGIRLLGGRRLAAPYRRNAEHNGKEGGGNSFITRCVL